MAVDLAKYVVSLEAETARYTQQLQSANNKLEQFEKRNTASLQRLDRGFTDMSNRFTLVAAKLRSVFSLFGVAFGVRAFAGWIRDAIEVDKLTQQQAKSIGAAADAMKALNAGFQDLARTAATELAPAMEKAAKFWKEFFFPSSSSFGAEADALRDQVAEQITEVERLQRLLSTQTAGDANSNWFQRFVFGEHSDNIAQTTTNLAAARAELERLRTALLASQGGGTEPSYEQFLGQIQLDEEMRRLAAIAKGQDLSPGLEAYIEGLKEAEALTASMRTDVEEQIDAWDRAKSLFDQGILPAETLRRLDEKQLQAFDVNEIRAKYKAPLKELETEASKTAKMIGASFQDSFSGWLVGADRNFKDLLKRMTADLATSALFKGLAGLFPGGSFFSNFFGGARAEGGPVSAGRAYLVGERGPEMFIPSGSGMIATGGGGGGVTINQVNTFNGGDAREQAAAIAANNSKLKQDIMATIKDRQRRRTF